MQYQYFYGKSIHFLTKENGYGMIKNKANNDKIQVD